MQCKHCDREFNAVTAPKCGDSHGDAPLCNFCGLCQGVESTPGQKDTARAMAKYFEELAAKFPLLPRWPL